MAKELRLTTNGEEVAYRNSPSDQPGHDMFRKVVLHLSAIQDANRLCRGPDLRTHLDDSGRSRDGGGFWRSNNNTSSYNHAGGPTLRKPVARRIPITNYDPATLPPEERIRLHEPQTNNQ